MLEATAAGDAERARWGSSVELVLEGVRLELGGTEVLKGIDLQVAGGELVALLGPSGSGKSTLLRVIAGLEPLQVGRVLFGGEDASSIRLQQRNVGLVFQHYALFRHMSVFDNVAFGMRVKPRGQRLSRTAIRERATELLRMVKLEEFASRFPAQLSGGQRQRVALARALAIDPQLLLLDEPFGALDARVRRELRRSVREIHDGTGYTTLFVTHDQEEAMELADRVVVMNDGVIEQVGTPDELHDHPATRFVFDFVGESSSLPVEVAAGKVLWNGADLGLAARGRRDGAALLVLRPHHLVVRARPPEAGEIPGTVRASRRNSGWRRLELDVGGGHRLEADVDEEQRVVAGAEVAIKPLRYQLFDP